MQAFGVIHPQKQQEKRSKEGVDSSSIGSALCSSTPPVHPTNPHSPNAVVAGPPPTPPTSNGNHHFCRAEQQKQFIPSTPTHCRREWEKAHQSIMNNNHTTSSFSKAVYPFQASARQYSGKSGRFKPTSMASSSYLSQSDGEETCYVKIVEDSRADSLELLMEGMNGSQYRYKVLQQPVGSQSPKPGVLDNGQEGVKQPLVANPVEGRVIKKPISRTPKPLQSRHSEGDLNGARRKAERNGFPVNGARKNGGKHPPSPTNQMVIPTPDMLNNQMISVVDFQSNRFPPAIHHQPLTSPRYHSTPAIGDMRPPPHNQPLMSPTVGAVQLNPNQHQQVPVRQPVFPNQQIPPQNQLMRMPYVVHEPQGAQAARSYSPEICLAGCVFLILDDYSPSQVDRAGMCAVIRFHGGDVEQHNPRGIPDRVTHVVCSTVAHNELLIHQALNDRRKRIVTLQWLNETIMKKRIETPTKACHLPTCWNENNRPAIGRIITTAGFDDLETTNLKWMINAIGGRYTPTLSAHNHLLVSKSFAGPQAPTNTRLEKAKQMGVRIVNYQWLVEMYFGSARAMNDLANPNYSPMNGMSHFENHSTQSLERISDFCQKLLCSWRLAITLNDDTINMAIELKRNVENDKTVFPHRQFKYSLDDAPSEEQIQQSIEILKQAGKESKNVRVHFEGLLPQQIECLSKKLRFLGAEVSDSVGECTHLVVSSLERTVKLLEAMAQGKNVVSPEWIQQSFSLLKLVDCFDYFIHDPENERKYGYCLKDSILQARHRKVFEDVTFHLSQNVRPSFVLLSQMIIAGGGTVERERPTKKRLAKCIETDSTFLIVVGESDLHLYQYLINCNFPLFNEEFVMMAILRHEIDFTPTAYRISPALLKPLLLSSPSAQIGPVPSIPMAVAPKAVVMRPDRVIKAA